ncbi:MAG: hypothetical protein AAF192_20930, partial [Pseudomonadota bacterium]
MAGPTLRLRARRSEGRGSNGAAGTAARDAGVTAAGWSLLRLPGAVAGLMQDWFDAHAPGKKNRALSLLRAA